MRTLKCNGMGLPLNKVHLTLYYRTVIYTMPLKAKPHFVDYNFQHR